MTATATQAGMSSPRKFWCSCGLGYLRESGRDRHCLLMKHEPGAAALPHVRRRARTKRENPPER
jgi:hypothetical protein